MSHIILIGGGTRGAEGATAPPDFKIYAFGPPQIFTQEISLHQLGIEHVLIISFFCVTCIRF